MNSHRISKRESEILSCLAKGLTTSETAKILNISSETVKTHRSKLLIKLKAKNAFQLGIKVAHLELTTL